ncbi:hypothetical protein E1269_09530 [Jiangella asiatica]|uniref:Uncharacterized protein n=1 Tax=Jiangella asiatica TaxID=2530372 RepID=A0A4R5DLH3_9ACTN|nr:hypothetical protein E1269_09530 [Jiangella asiatica]
MSAIVLARRRRLGEPLHCLEPGRTYWAVRLPAGANAFNVLLVKRFMVGLSHDVDEAADPAALVCPAADHPRHRRAGRVPGRAAHLDGAADRDLPALPANVRPRPGASKGPHAAPAPPRAHTPRAPAPDRR